MTIGNPRLSEAEAHQELILMDSRVAGIIDESFFDRFRRRDLSHFDVLKEFGRLFDETRVCGGKIVHLGKIISNEILEFLESDPDAPSGLLLSTALKTMAESVPFLGPLLVPISVVVDDHGFGSLLAGTGFPEKLERQGRIFFVRFAHILNMSKGLLSSQENMSLNPVTFEEPSPFELDDSENPFDLDDPDTISETTAAVVKLLIKIALSAGNFSDPERQLIAGMLESLGESISQSQFEYLVQEASKESLEVILNGVAHQPVLFKERLLLSGMLLSAADKRVDTIEKKLLAQASQLLGISRERYSEIAKDALYLIKVRNAHLSGEAENVGEHSVKIAPPQRSLVAGPTPEILRSARTPETPSEVANHANPKDGKGLLQPSDTSSARTEHLPAVGSGPVQKVSSESKSPLSPKSAITWRCPACNMPQFREFDECPQCGIIVAKFKQILSRSQSICLPEEYVEVPPEPVEEEPVSDRDEPSESHSLANCPACNALLRTGSKFCHSCGNRIV
ncbi:MAG: hypothetical protein HY912_19705 [Desulfomonile tiedjei]|uniref:Zinc-ribbon domain-containing protein n=1 Tax=Desulfomonile tiedjei TaxID=2358 RepID=A0A9D6V6E4_9BACT|nr:hypothetical protein [Desulfomonile tiedjei]